MNIEPALASLDKLTKAKKLPDVSGFISFDPEEVAEMLEMDVNHCSGGKPASFAAKEDLAVVRGLLTALAKSTIKIKNAAAIAADLKDIEQELSQAEKQQVKFHFVVLD